MKIQMGPMGNVIQGHCLDVNHKAFEKALQAYDPMLYVRWNPKRLKGHGCWQIRRKPEFNSALDIVEFDNAIIINTGPYEVELVHGIMDCAYLNYDQLRKLKEMDTWQYGTSSQYQDLVERKTADRREKERQQGLIARKEAANYFRNEIEAFRQYILNGGNPHMIGAFWEKVQALE